MKESKKEGGGMGDGDGRRERKRKRERERERERERDCSLATDKEQKGEMRNIERGKLVGVGGEWEGVGGGEDSKKEDRRVHGKKRKGVRIE